MKRITFALLFALALISARPVEESATPHPIRFEVRKGFWSVEGHFSQLETSIHLDPLSPEQSFIQGKACVSTIDTDNSTRDRHLMGEDWFDAVHHPYIEMRAVSVEKKGQDYIGHFLISIKGKKISKELSFALEEGEEAAYLVADFSLNRKAFQLEGSNPIMEALLGDEVDIYLKIPLNVQAI